MPLRKTVITLGLILLVQLPVTAQNHRDQDSSYVKPTELKLPENVKIVLIQEMLTITKLMGSLLEYIVQGDAMSTSHTASEIRDTNLKQEFNSRELKEIIKILPKGFIKFDQKFHMTANELSKAADSGDFKTAIELYTKMTQLCFSCHATYAKDRFKNLSTEE